ncbi:MAG: hypothetical protein EHM64_00205 [Ignavibacteriae bacterium]|nr:MAG: hypothetical protein EHM64_00205 [Ignavibacteriota bacterium]
MAIASFRKTAPATTAAPTGVVAAAAAAVPSPEQPAPAGAVAAPASSAMEAYTPSSPITRRPAGPATDDVVGDVDFSDIRLPRLNLVQRTGELPDKFDFGSIVLNKEAVLPQPVRFIALNMKKQWQEKTEYGSGESGQVFNSREEVIAAGGTFGFKDGQFSELAHVHLLVEKPEGFETDPANAGVVDLFMYEIGGAVWAPAVISVGRSAYTSMAKALLTARQFTLRDGLWRGLWELSAAVQKGAKGSWVTPTPKFIGKLDEELSALTSRIRKGE